MDWTLAGVQKHTMGYKGVLIGQASQAATRRLAPGAGNTPQVVPASALVYLT